MSIVRYTNKKTGVVTLYESTSHYDPETKQSRPIRKYLGREDPVTGKLIPSTGRRGKKKRDPNTSGSVVTAPPEGSVTTAPKTEYGQEISALKTLVKEQADTIKKLEVEKSSIAKKLSDLLDELTN